MGTLSEAAPSDVDQTPPEHSCSFKAGFSTPVCRLTAGLTGGTASDSVGQLTCRIWALLSVSFNKVSGE